MSFQSPVPSSWPFLATVVDGDLLAGFATAASTALHLLHDVLIARLSFAKK